MPYAWQRRGQPPVELPAVRGRGGHSVLGFWQAAVAGQPLVAYQRAGALTADLFALAVDEFSRSRRGPTVLVLDNASIHKAQVVQARHAEWAARGLTLLFLPPYSPERNQSERRWHRCKHYGLRPEDYSTDATLLKRIEYVLRQVGRIYILPDHLGGGFSRRAGGRPGGRLRRAGAGWCARASAFASRAGRRQCGPGGRRARPGPGIPRAPS